MVWLIAFLGSVFFMFFDVFYLYCFLLVFIFSFFFCWGGFWFGGIFFLDSISFFLIFLRVLVFLFCFFSRLVDFWGRNYSRLFILCLGRIFFFLFLRFSCFRHIFFYVSFEFTFILMFFFLYGWGYSPERMVASFYIVFYTLVVSFPFLIFLVLLSIEEGLSGKFMVWGFWSNYWWISLVFVFLVKLPVYGVHLWLPKAHVEAPVSGSMVLAGVLLKLGTYGFLRFRSFVLGHLILLKGYFVSLGVLGGLYSCFLCLRQSDLKAFVAYSSVCHIGFGLGGLYRGRILGLRGRVFIMIAHGFCSSCLFYILYVFYERFFTRSGIILKGVGYLFPMMLLVWFVFSVLNMGVPPSFSFFSEVFILTGLGGINLYTFVFSGLLLLFSGFYGIFLYVISCHSVNLLRAWSFSFTAREFLNFYGHLFFLVFLVFSLDFFYF